MLDVMFTTPEFANTCSNAEAVKWSSSDKALNAMRATLKSGGLYMQDIISASKYSQPSVSKAMKILEANNEVISVRGGRGKPVYFELVA